MAHSKFFILVKKALLIVLVVLLAMVGFTRRPTVTLAAGNTYAVNSTSDLPDMDQGDGLCLTSEGTCTLRAAIMQANYSIGADTITIPAGVYQLTRVGNDDVAVLGDLDITDNLTIQGAGSGITIVDGNGVLINDRLFQIFTTSKVTDISGLTIRNGKKDSGPFDAGAGLYWEGDNSQLTLSDVVIEGNTASYAGGISLNYSPTGDQVNLDHVIIRGNSATAAGGGLTADFYDFATFDMHDSQIYNNTAFQGGGITFQATILQFSLSSVSIENSQIFSNTASHGAGFDNIAGDTTTPIKISNSNIYQNHANSFGGAIENSGTLAISTTTLDANSAGTNGGGIFNDDNGHLDINQTTVSNNTAQYGGGIYSGFNIYNNGTLIMTNSTLSGNTASRDGGGIYATGGHISLYNDSIARNQVMVPGDITYPGMGGGIYINSPTLLFTSDSLYGDNTHQYQLLPTVEDDCYGTVNSFGYNLFGEVANCIVDGSTNGNIIGLDPRIGPLQNYGGTTKTLLPLSGSPVIDAGQTPSCNDVNGSPLTTDQRGVMRPLGAACDIGAVESAPFSVILPVMLK